MASWIRIRNSVLTDSDIEPFLYIEDLKKFQKISSIRAVITKLAGSGFAIQDNESNGSEEIFFTDPQH